MRRDDPDLETVEATPPLAYPAHVVVEALGPVVAPRRLERMRAVISQRTRSIIPVLDGLSDPHNMSAILRSSDAFGLQEVHVVETDQSLSAARRVARGSERWLDIAKHPSEVGLVRAMEARGCRLFVAAADGDLSPESIGDEPGPVAVVFGNEHRGVSKVIRDAAAGTFSVAMRGFVESLNVSVAAAISLRAVRGNRPGDLSDSQREMLLARFLLKTVANAEELLVRHMDQHKNDVVLETIPPQSAPPVR